METSRTENTIGVVALDAILSNSSLGEREVNTIREMRVLRDVHYEFVSILYFG